MSKPTADQFPLPEPRYTAKRARDLLPFGPALAGFAPEQAQATVELLRGKTIPEIQELLDAGQLNSTLLVTYYVDRIRRFDLNNFNSVLTLNPDALRDRCNPRPGASHPPGPWSLAWHTALDQGQHRDR